MRTYLRTDTAVLVHLAETKTADHRQAAYFCCVPEDANRLSLHTCAARFPPLSPARVFGEVNAFVRFLRAGHAASVADLINSIGR